MPDPTTTNVALAVPTRGSNDGVWDTPVNGDFTLIDAMFGSVTTKSLSSSPVTLTTTEAQVSVLKFTGALSANVQITLPAIIKTWTVLNLCTGNFVVTLTDGNNTLGVPPGEPIDIFSDGGSLLRFKNLGRVGSYIDFATLTMPGWVSACSTPPVLLCDGSSFSAVTYPILNLVLGGTTLPDFRGRLGAFNDASQGRITTAGSGIDGNTLFAAGGAQNVSVLQANLPNVNFTVSTNSASGTATVAGQAALAVPSTAGPIAAGTGGSATYATSAFSALSISIPTLSGTAASGGSGTAINKMPPAIIAGIRTIVAG